MQFRFLKVGENRLLKVQNIACISSETGNGFLLSTGGDDADEVLATTITVIPSSGATINATGPATGPYYFIAGERVFLWGAGSTDPNFFGVCTIEGEISRTD